MLYSCCYVVSIIMKENILMGRENSNGHKLKKKQIIHNIQSTIFINELTCYIDTYIEREALFKVNNKQLRAKIQSHLQDWVNTLLIDTPSMFSVVSIVCDETNNPISVIESNELRVDSKCQHANSDTWVTIQHQHGVIR